MGIASRVHMHALSPWAHTMHAALARMRVRPSIPYSQ